MDHAEFGQLLRDRRKEAGLSLRRLAQLSSVHQGTLSHAEQGQRRGLSEQSAQDVDATLGANGEIVRGWRSLPSQNERSSPIPNQLPPAPTLFGRDELLSQIIERGTQPATEQSSPTVLLLTGPGGVGKTAVAIAAAHQLSDRLSTGALINDMRGWDEHSEPRSTWDVLHRWARALGAPASEAGGDHDDLVALWRSMTAGRRMVAVIDNAQADQVDELVPASPGSVILVTSRERMITTAVPLERLSVPPLTTNDALDVLSLHSGYPHHVVGPLADRCAGLPLALRVAGEDAGAHWLEEEIPDMAANWDDLPHHSAIDRATALSYRGLSPEGARAWRLLAHLGNPSLEAAAAALGLSATATRRLLQEAMRANLLDRDAGFWAYHDLHRDYALRVSRDEDTSEEISEAVYRALTWYLHGLSSADSWFAARNDLPELVALPEGITAPAFASYDEAFEWIDFRWSQLPAAVQTAASHGWATLSWQLSALHVHWSFLVKPWSAWSRACRTAYDAAREADDLDGQAWMQHILGSIAGDQDHYTAAISHTDAALEFRRHLGSPRDIGWAAVNAVRWRLATEADEAEISPLIDEIINNHESVGMQAGVCLGWCFRGTLAARRGDFDEAIGHLHQAQVGTADLADPAVYCYIHTSLAQVEVQAGRLEGARQHAEHSDAYARRSGADWFRIGALSVAAETYTSGDPRLWETLHLATTMADKLGDPREPELRERLDRLDT